VYHPLLQLGMGEAEPASSLLVAERRGLRAEAPYRGEEQLVQRTRIGHRRLHYWN
jgi:hypothetical protein